MPGRATWEKPQVIRRQKAGPRRTQRLSFYGAFVRKDKAGQTEEFKVDECE